MKHLLFWTSMLFVIGMVITVGIAWSIAIARPYSHNSRISFHDEDGWTHATELAWYVCIRKWRGSIAVWRNSPAFNTEKWKSPVILEEEVPHWSRAKIAPVERDPPDWRYYPVQIEYAHGWPKIAMYSELSARIEGAYKQPLFTSMDMGYIVSHKHNTNPILYNIRILPYGIIWPNFLFNSAFYTVILGGLWIAFCATRRRMRQSRGRCLQCGYDLRHDLQSGCPECGWRRFTDED